MKAKQCNKRYMIVIMTSYKHLGESLQLRLFSTCDIIIIILRCCFTIKFLNFNHQTIITSSFQYYVIITNMYLKLIFKSNRFNKRNDKKTFKFYQNKQYFIVILFRHCKKVNHALPETVLEINLHSVFRTSVNIHNNE